MNGTQHDILHPVAAAYVAAVRDALSDLPEDELAEVIDDLAVHLEQVSGELGDDLSDAALVERLGYPASYAAELRAAADFPEESLDQGRRPPRRFARWLANWAVRLTLAGAAITAIMSVQADGNAQEAIGLALATVACALVAGLIWLPLAGAGLDLRRAWNALPDADRWARLLERVRRESWGAATLDFLGSLRPAWWVARAWVASQILAAYTGDFRFPFPNLPMGMALFVGLTVLSVWWGRVATRGWASVRRRTISDIGNMLLVILLPVVIAGVVRDTSAAAEVYDPYVPETYSPDVMQNEFGEPVTNLFVYSQDGTLLEDVRIYDQSGTPLHIEVDGTCIEESGYVEGGPKSNLYPRPVFPLEYDEGTCDEAKPVPPFTTVVPGDTTETPPVDPLK